MDLKKILIVFLLVVSNTLHVMGQVDYRQQYFNGKALFREEKYNLAMESFKPLIAYDNKNPFAQYASFYYAVSAYKQGYTSVAKDMFSQVQRLYPQWEKINEVTYWQAIILFDNKDYFQALRTLDGLKSEGIRENIENAKQHYLREITDTETLRMMLEEYPRDEVIARFLARSLAKNITDRETREELESVIDKYKFERGDFVAEAPPTYFKETYTVSVLMPFMVKTLSPNVNKKPNQIILDFYEGMKLAVDTLKTGGVEIDLRAYDTERKGERIDAVLEKEELANSDLLVGPFFQEENAAVQKFAFENKINVFNPFTNNADLIQNNPYGFLLQPSHETLGRKTGEFAAAHTQKKNALIFYGPNVKDSVMATSFQQAAQANGLKVVYAYEIPTEASSRIITILASPTEYDKWKRPIRFTLPKDSIGCIYVASNDPLIYSKVISSVETRGDSIMILGSETWLGQNDAVDFDKYRRLNIVFASPNHTAFSSKEYKAFLNSYIRRHGKYPDEFVRRGYAFMMFIGKNFKNYGVYFQEGLLNEERVSGVLAEGYNYQYSRDNQFVPFIKSDDGEMVVIKSEK